MLSYKGKSVKPILGRKSKSSKRVPPHTLWEFKPKLKNEGVILHNILGIYDIPFYRVIVDDVRGLITQLVRNHGFNDGSKRYKIIKDYTIELIEGRNPENPGWLATSEVHRVPSALGINMIQLVVDYLNCTEASMKPKYYQVINTILNIVRMVDGLVDADLVSVTKKAIPIDQILLDEFTDYVNESLDSIKPLDNNVNLFNIRFNIRKNGPNGVPKIESSIQEARELLNNKLRHPFKIICEELNCYYLYEYLELLTSDAGRDHATLEQQPESKRTTKLRVLAEVPDSGFKTRLVAIVDFWSQLVLEPFRAHVQRVIETKFELTDFRKNQDLGVAKMKEFQQRCLERDTIIKNGEAITLDAKHLKCYDISSWTDKFHRDLQKIVVRQLFGPRFAEAWGQLVVHCDWYYPKLDCTIKYGQGQGMGTNGSFDIATLSDHLFINFLIDKKSGWKGVFPNNQCYGKVGDDLWIYDPENLIPEYYSKISLPINHSKSKQFVEGNSYTEFCSRTYLNAIDVSRISPKIISKSKDFRYIPALLGLCSNRGIQLDASSFETLNNNVKNSEETYLHKLQVWIVGMLLIGQYEQGSYFQNLTYDYLENGNWLVGDLVKRTLQDTNLLCRLMVAHSIVTIIENKEAVEDLIFDNVDAMDDYSDEITRLVEPGTNLFDARSEMHCILANHLGLQILSPKQIVVFGRYVDQRTLVRDSLDEANFNAATATDIKDIVQYGRDLSEIAQKSCYDQGNINYDVNRIVGTQFRIVKTLERMDKDYKTLSGLQSTQLRSLWQDLPYDEIVDRFPESLPTLLVDS